MNACHDFISSSQRLVELYNNGDITINYLTRKLENIAADLEFEYQNK